MPRRCECNKESCRLCWLYHNDPRYRARWGGEPSLARKAVSFLGAVTRHVAAGSPKASEEEKARRLAVCEACPHKAPAKNRCRICGCGLSLKASWADQKCPIGKW